MKKHIFGFFLAVLYIPLAFGADGASASRAGNTNNDVVSASRATARVNATTNRGVAQPNDKVAASVTGRNNNRASRDDSGVHNVSSRTATNNASTTTSSTPTARNVRVSRAAAGAAAVQSRNANSGVVVGRNTNTATGVARNDGASRRAGVVRRPTSADNGLHTKIATDARGTTDSDEKSVGARAATTTPTRESIAEAKERLEQTAELNTSCQKQYNDCMDQFCAVIDANQKRCSCSANLSRYAKVESAVKEANSQLNDVAQRIRYVGLSADEIRAIMSATEAEDALSRNVDNTETRGMLDDIEKLIKNPTSNSASMSSASDFGLDLDLDFSSNASDMFNLDFLNTDSNSMANLRGTELYNAAKKRCKTVLAQCTDAGATEKQITANYDLAIDKDCIAYEQGLSKMNDTLKSNVRSANNMLQKARLAVMRDKNEYDAKGCIGALETCMTDDMVCGEDYVKCLDPTKRYIDENGTVVLGQNIADITSFMKNYSNNSISAEFLTSAYSNPISQSICKTDGDGKCVVKYLLQKIGTKQKVTDEGLCRAVLDKCQMYTYDSNSNYKPYNDVVVNYVQRAMVNIKAAQQRIISDYAANCMTDIATCYNKQVTQVNTWTSSANVNSIYNVMTGACRNVALTCAYAVFAADDNLCPANGTDTQKCIKNISEIFYQSLLCPENSTFTNTTKDNATDDKKHYVNSNCKCNDGYEVVGGQCLSVCPDGYTRNVITGVCTDDKKSDDKNSETPTAEDSQESGDENAGGGSNPENSTYECPANSHHNESCSNSLVCIGQCECENGFKAELGACKKISTSGGNNLDNNGPLHSSVSCPEHSSEASDGTGDILDGACTCGANYVPNADGNACTTCAERIPHSVYSDTATAKTSTQLLVPDINGNVIPHCKCESGYYAFKESASSAEQCIDKTTAETKCNNIKVGVNNTHKWNKTFGSCDDNCTAVWASKNNYVGDSPATASFDPTATALPNMCVVKYQYKGIVTPGCRCNNWTIYNAETGKARCTGDSIGTSSVYENTCEYPYAWDSSNADERTKCSQPQMYCATVVQN